MARTSWVPGDGHACTPRIGAVVERKATCIYCGQILVRIMHAPGHRIGGKPCGFLDSWRHCFIPQTVVDAAAKSADLLTIPEWVVG